MQVHSLSAKQDVPRGLIQSKISHLVFKIHFNIISQFILIFDICGTVHRHLINKDHKRDAACSICLYYACGSTLHVSGALCTHHQECIETVHADSGTIVF